MKIYTFTPQYSVRTTNAEPEITLSGIRLVRRKLDEHIARRIHKGVTPNGFASEVYIKADGNGAYNIWQWGNPEPLATGLSIIRASRYLAQYHDKLFRERNLPWKIYFTDISEARSYAINQLQELFGMAETQAQQAWDRMNSQNFAPMQQQWAEEEEMAKGYETIIPYLPGESFADTTKRLAEALPERLPPEQFYAIARTIRRKKVMNNE
jgi:hypothetical protein